VAKAVKSVVTTAVTATKKVLASPVGRIVATIALTYALGPVGASWGLSAGQAASLGAAISSATVTAASGGSAKDVFKAAAFAAIAAPEGVVGSYVSASTKVIAGQNEFARAALNFGAETAISTGVARLSGESLEDSVKQGLTSATIALGTDLAQKGLNYKSAGDKVTELADTNKAAEAMAPKSVDPNIELDNDVAFFKGSGTREFKAGQAAVDADVLPNPQLKAIADAQAPYIRETLDNWNNTVANGDPTYNYPSVVEPNGIFSKPVINDAGVAVTTKLAGGTTPAPGGVPGIGASIKKIGGGIADFAQGNFKQGFDDVVQGGGDLFFPGTPPAPTTAQVVNSESFKNAIDSGVTPDVALKSVTAELTQAAPGLLRTYGPATAAGIAGLALSGAFDPPDQPQSKLQEQLTGTPGEDKIKEDPSKYLVQNLAGVPYDDKGNIVQGSTVEGGTVSPKKVTANFNNDRVGLEDIMVATEDMGQQQKYLVDPYQAYLQQMAAQQQQPRYYAEGGVIQPNTTIPIKAYTLEDIKSSTPGLPKTTTGGTTTGGATTGGTTTGGTTTGGATTGGTTTGGTTTGGATTGGTTTGGATTGGATTGGATTGGATTGGATAMGVQSPFEFYYQYYKPKPVSTSGSSTVSTNTPVMGPNALFLHYYNQYLDALSKQPKQYAMGGIADLPAAPMQAPPAGIAALREGGNSNYPRRTGQISGPGTEKSDSIPAMLSDGEFVMTASAVRGLGKGSRREGAKRMYALMHQLERNAARG
jgi:hypothetical protein